MTGVQTCALPISRRGRQMEKRDSDVLDYQCPAGTYWGKLGPIRSRSVLCISQKSVTLPTASRLSAAGPAGTPSSAWPFCLRTSLFSSGLKTFDTPNALQGRFRDQSFFPLLASPHPYTPPAPIALSCLETFDTQIAHSALFATNLFPQVSAKAKQNIYI